VDHSICPLLITTLPELSGQEISTAVEHMSGASPLPPRHAEAAAVLSALITESGIAGQLLLMGVRRNR
jgi:hypothetical protein